MTLTLELLSRIEKDIEELRNANGQAGFSLYVSFAGIAATSYLLLRELANVNDLPFSQIATIFLAGLLLLKIPWAIYQIVNVDYAKKRRHEPGRFFWSNDFFFELRTSGIFQGLVFLASFLVTFFLPIPIWVKLFTGLSFLLYLFIIGLVVIFSMRQEAYAPSNTKPGFIVWAPVPFIIATALSIPGLTLQMEKPFGSQTGGYLIAGLLLTIIFFIDLIIRLSTPSLLLEKLQRLRYDIIFLKANLEDAWTRYEVYVDGHDISEELRVELDEIMQQFNSLEFHQAQKEESLTNIRKQLTESQKQDKLSAADFQPVDKEKERCYSEEINQVYVSLGARLEALEAQIQKISRSTQEWKRADEYHQFILSRFETIGEKEAQLQRRGKRWTK